MKFSAVKVLKALVVSLPTEALAKVGRFALVAIFLFFALALFLFAAPKIDKPVEASHGFGACTISNSSVQAGNNKSVSFTGLNSGWSVRLFGTAGNAVLGTTPFAIPGPTSKSYTIPLTTVPASGYNIVVVTSDDGGSVTCSGGPFSVTAPPAANSCTYHLLDISVVGGTNVRVSIDTGDSGQFRGSILQGTTVVANGTRNGPGTLNITAPSPTTTSTYAILAQDTDSGPITCSLSSGGTGLTVTAAPPAGFPFTLGSASVSGTSATFSITPAAGSGSILFIKDLSTSIPIPTGATSITWTGAAGAHQAVISAFGVDVSNTVSFTLASTGFPFTLGDPPTISDTTATFSITPAAGVGSILFLKDLSTSIPIPTGATSISWTGAAGAHQAVISAFGVDVSNTVSFTLVSGGFPFTLSVNNVTGNTVTFGITPTPGPSVIVIKDSSGIRQSPDPDSTDNASPQWTGPNGTFTAVVSAFATDVSNTISFTLPGGTTTGACPATVTTAVEAVNKYNCTVINSGTFDDKPFIKNQLFAIQDGIFLLFTGKSRLNPETDNVTAGTGALSASGKLVTAMYRRPPVSGVEYFASQFQKFNPVQPAYAAQTGGIGYNALTPVQPIWEAFRNMSYVGFIVVFVVIGFMIMFRAHISPQAVATVQDSLPRVVIALILVTFSYAIAGLLIDLMFLLLNVLINALRLANLLPNYNDNIFTKSVFGVVFSSWKDTFTTVADTIANLIDGVVSLPVLDKILGFFGGTLAAIVVGIAMLFIMFRVFFMLLIAYATIIIMTIAAPFYFLFQALPGNNGAKDWFKQMAANISVFPVTALMFILAGILGGIPALGGPSGGAITSQQVGQFPLLTGDIDSTVIGRLIGIGLLLMTPSAADMVKKAIGATGGPSLGAGASALAAGAGVAYTASGARGTVRGIQGGLQTAEQERGEKLVSRLPYFGSQVRERRKLLGLRQTQ